MPLLAVSARQFSIPGYITRSVSRKGAAMRSRVFELSEFQHVPHADHLFLDGL